MVAHCAIAFAPSLPSKVPELLADSAGFLYAPATANVPVSWIALRRSCAAGGLRKYLSYAVITADSFAVAGRFSFS
jgi:hypothetical protein